MKLAINMLVVFTSIYCLVITFSWAQRIRVKRTDLEKSKYIYKDLQTKQTTDIDVCGTSVDNSLDNKHTRRSIQLNFDNYTTTSPTTTDYLSILSPEFINCSHITVEPECFQKLQNGSVFVPLYNMIFDVTNYVIIKDLLFVCPNFFKDFTEEEKFPTHISDVSTACIWISAICIILHIIMFICVKKMRNLPGYCLVSLCIALLSAYACSLIQAEIMDQDDCRVIGMFLLYFFLASFFWMNVMAYDVWRSIRLATCKLRLTADRPIMVRFTRYSVYGWGSPLMIIIASIIVHHTTSSVKYKLIFDVSTCWFTYKQALTLYFASPLFTLLVINIFFFISSFWMISSATMSKSQSRNQTGSDLWTRLLLSLRLASVMGFMWIFGIIAIISQKLWLWYLYAACNALQGVFIFFSFTMSERTRKAFKDALKRRKFSSPPTQTSNSSQPGTFV